MTCDIILGDCRESLRRMESKSVHCCVTSPPYFGLRDYGHEEQIGLEATPDEFVSAMVSVFREVRRVLRDDGTLWLNLGDSYVSAPTGSLGDKVALGGGHDNQAAALNRPDKTGFGIPVKNLIGIPWRVAFALQADGWYLRQDIIWHKPNPMPESVKDRCTKAHEYIFLLSKSDRYYFDADAIKEDAVKGAAGSTFHNGKTAEHQANRSSVKDRVEDGKRNKRSVWTVSTKPFKGAHFATFPPDLVKPCILAGCPKGGTVLDPFGGAGTTGLVADANGRDAVLCEINRKYAVIAAERIGLSAQLKIEAKNGKEAA